MFILITIMRISGTIKGNINNIQFDLQLKEAFKYLICSYKQKYFGE